MCSQKGSFRKAWNCEIHNTSVKAEKSFELSLLSYAVAFHPLQTPLFCISVLGVYWMSAQRCFFKIQWWLLGIRSCLKYGFVFGITFFVLIGKNIFKVHRNMILLFYYAVFDDIFVHTYTIRFCKTKMLFLILWFSNKNSFKSFINIGKRLLIITRILILYKYIQVCNLQQNV